MNRFRLSPPLSTLPLSILLLSFLFAAAGRAEPPRGESIETDDLPNWVEAPPWLDDSPHRWPVQSTPASTPELSRQALEAQTRAAAETYLETLLDDPAASLAIELTDGWIAARIDPDRRYEGEIRVGTERLYVAAAELRFDDDDQQWIRDRWRSHRVAHRLGGLAIAVGSGVGLLWLGTVGLSIVVGRRERRLG